MASVPSLFSKNMLMSPLGVTMQNRLFSSEQQKEQKEEGVQEAKEDEKVAETSQEGASVKEGGGGETQGEAEAPETPREPTEEEKLQAAVEELKSKLQEAENNRVRAYADAENARRIAKNDVKRERDFALKSFAKSLLEVSDNLDLAIQSVDEEKVGEDDHMLKTLLEGVQMTQKGLLKAFGSHGIQKFGQEGDTFDPNFHDALFEYDDPSKPPSTVGQLMKAGFTLNGMVIRPAQVGTIKKREGEPATEEKKEEGA
jgi:molecular chaperone GrpE